MTLELGNREPFSGNCEIGLRKKFRTSFEKNFTKFLILNVDNDAHLIPKNMRYRRAAPHISLMYTRALIAGIFEAANFVY